MEQKNYFWQNSLGKVAIISAMALLLLIPLGMVRRQVRERSDNHSQAMNDITKSWGSAHTFAGPTLEQYTVSKDSGKETLSAILYPDSLKYVVNAVSSELHRSVYDVSVYTADLSIQGCYVLDAKILEADLIKLSLCMGDLKGIQGMPTFMLNGIELNISSDALSTSSIQVIKAEIALPEGAREGDVLPFLVTMKVNGTESLFITPVGRVTEVLMTSDYPDPSFVGDYLPAERDVRADGFTARWYVSQIARTSSSGYSFGVRMVKPVTQYRQTERATKYGLLIIFLVFIAGFVVEIISKKPINIIQYLVIGASLVLFYSLLLAFSDFLSFGPSYLIAAVMTTVALSAYFRGIVRNKWAYLLAGLVALTYGVIYILLQMETFAFLTGTLLLFLILCIIMALTRNMKFEDAKLFRAAKKPASE